MKIQPLGERLLIKQLKQHEEKTKSGLYLPKDSKEKKEGIVVEIGTDREGNSLPVKAGDHIIYSGYSSEEIEIEGEKHLIIDFKDVVARVIK